MTFFHQKKTLASEHFLDASFALVSIRWPHPSLLGVLSQRLFFLTNTAFSFQI